MPASSGIQLIRFSGLVCYLLLLSACGGGGSGASPSPGPGLGPTPTTTYTIGGTISGLTSGGLVLADSANTTEPSSGATSFTFSQALASGASYNVTVQTQPKDQNCTVTNGTGTVATSNVTAIAVACTTAYTISGTVAGLTQAGLELAAAGQTIDVPAGATSFAFPTPVSPGTAYTVSAQTTPASEVCTLANASGTATGDVNNVEVSCSPIQGTGLGWVPYWDPQNGSLAVFASSSVPNSLAGGYPLAASGAKVLGASQYWQSSGGQLTFGHWWFSLLFAAPGADGNVHIYTVNLTNASSVAPTPVQVGALSVPSAASICEVSSTGQASLSDPTTAFVVLHLAPAGGACFSSTDTYQLVHFADAPTVVPTQLSLKSTYILPQYAASGALSRILTVDFPSSSVLAYTDASFASSSAVITGIGGVIQEVAHYYVDTSGDFLGDTVYLAVAQGTANAWDLWRIPPSGAASKVYSASGTPGFSTGIADNGNVYFVDMAQSQLVELSASVASPTPVKLAAVDSQTQLIGSNNASVVFSRVSFGATTQTVFLDSVSATGGAAQTPAPVWGATSGSPGQYANISGLSAFMAVPSWGDYKDAKLFVSVGSLASGYSQIQPPSAALSMAPQTLANSAVLPNGLPGSVGNVFQVQGNALYSVPVSNTASSSALMTGGGMPFSLYTGALSVSFNVTDSTSAGSSAFATGVISTTNPSTGQPMPTGMALNLTSNQGEYVNASGFTGTPTIPALPVFGLTPFVPSLPADLLQ